MADRRNGLDPEPMEMLEPVPMRPAIPELRRPRPGAGFEEVARIAADGCAAFTAHIPAIYRENNEQRGAINMMARNINRIATRLESLDSKVGEIHHRLIPVEQRPPMPSVDDITKGVKEGVLDAWEVKTSPGSEPRKSDSERVRKEMDERELHQDGLRWRARQEAWSKWKFTVSAGVAVALIVGALTIAWRVSVAIADARAEGVAEGRNLHLPEAATVAPNPAPEVLPPPPPHSK